VKPAFTAAARELRKGLAGPMQSGMERVCATTG
jgi:hypothetical protein